MIRHLSFITLAVSAALTLFIGGAADAAGPPLRTYRVTIENMTEGQPFSPGLAATHRANTNLFEVGGMASAGIEAIAEAGNEAPAVAMIDGAAGITDVFDINRPITPDGVTIGDFTDSFTFEITARPGDRLSLAVMLICTNDGFTGLDGGRLPAQGSVSYSINGYDAGTEDNTEMSDDIVDP